MNIRQLFAQFINFFTRLFTNPVSNPIVVPTTAEQVAVPAAVEQAVLVATAEPSGPNLNWMLPVSEDVKLSKIGRSWGELLDDYLWYELGDVESLTEAEEQEIVAMFFPSGKAGFGDVELHESSCIPGRTTVLRLRGKVKLLPSIELRGRYCPLYQVGHYDFSGSSKGAINFHTSWNRESEKPSAALSLN
jgi:hypothetical protein